MNKALVVLPLVLLTGCQELLCPLLGHFGGKFVGDREGDVEIDVAEAGDDDMAEASIRLSASPLDIFGTAVIDCNDGKFSTRLETDEDSAFGDFSGLLGDDQGSGEWSFNTGEAGTWDLSRLSD